MSAELVRTYFYDAAFPEGDPERPAQDSYFAKLRSFQLTQIRLGRLIRAESGTRQKGVDVLMAIDMLSKAYEGQFDIAVVLAGDDDFVDIVQSIRDEGKRVCGAFSESNVSPRLHDVFDRWIPLTRAALEPYMLAPDWKQGEKARSA